MKSSVFTSFLVSTIILMLLFTSAVLITSNEPNREEITSIHLAAGRSDYTPTNEWVEVTHTLTYKNPISISISSSYDVREIDIDKVTFTADELRSMSGGNADSPVISNSLTTEINGYVKNTFQTFAAGKLSEPVMGVEEEDLNLSYVDSDPYDPPITITANVQLTLGKLTFFTQQEDSYYDVVDLQELLEGCLLMGGRIYSDVAFFSYMGHNSTYKIGSEFDLYGLTDAKHNVEVGCTMTADIIALSEVSLQDTGGYITVTINNALSTKNLEATARMSYKCSENYEFNDEKWNTTAALDLSDFDKLAIDDSPVYVHSIKLENIETGLPQNIRDIEYASADGIRLLFENDILHIDKIKDYIETSVRDFEKDLKESLETEDDPGITLVWDMPTITGRDPRYYLKDPPSGYTIMGDERPCVCIVKSENVMEPGMYDDDLSPFALKGFLHGGATYSFDLNIGLSPNIAADLKPPSYIRLFDKNPKTTWGDRVTYFFPPLFNGEVKIYSSKAPQIDRYKALGYITADIKNVDIESTSSVHFEVDINLDGEFYQMSSQNTFINDYIPEGVELPYITSDVVRLAIQEGFLSTDELMTRMTNIIKENLTEFVEGTLVLIPDLDEESVTFDGDIEDMNGDTPVKFNIKGQTDSSYGSRSSGSQAALSVTSKTITLKLRGLEDWDVSWMVIFPAGLELKGDPIVSWSEGEISDLKTGRDGDRDNFQLTLYDNAKANVDVDINITLGFLASQFCMWLIIILIIILLVIVGIIALVVRSKRKKRKEEEEEMRRRDDGYDRDRGDRRGRGRDRDHDDHDRGGRGGRDRGYDDHDRPRRGGGGRRRGGGGGGGGGRGGPLGPA